MKSIDKLYTTTYTSTLESQTKNRTTMNQKKSEPPDYYVGKYKKLEAFDVCMDFSRDNYNLGVAIAYLLRAGKKADNPIENDIEKAIAHLKKELEYIAHERKQGNSGIDLTKDSFT